MFLKTPNIEQFVGKKFLCKSIFSFFKKVSWLKKVWVQLFPMQAKFGQIWSHCLSSGLVSAIHDTKLFHVAFDFTNFWTNQKKIIKPPKGRHEVCKGKKGDVASWHSGHRVHLQNRRSRFESRQGVRFYRNLYTLQCCYHNLCNMHCHCVHLRKINALKIFLMNCHSKRRCLSILPMYIDNASLHQSFE
jgi:hypothetical protein